MGNPMQVECKILSTTGAVLYWAWHDSLRAAVEECCRQGISLAGADLRGADLHGGGFNLGNFTGAHFEGANLVGVSFLNANLTNADFSGANVAEVTWTGTTVTGADLDATAVDATASTSAPASATSVANCIVKANAAGKIVAGFGGAASTLATLTAGSLVVENPANATATPTASKIPIATAQTYLADGWTRVPPTAVDFGVAPPYVVAAADKVIEVTTGAVSEDVDLPTATTCAGRIITVKKVDAGVGVVSVDPNGVEVIEGLGAGAPYPLGNIGELVHLQSNGVQWYVLGTTLAPGAHAATSHRNGQADEIVLPPTATAAATPFAVLVTHNVLLGASTAGFDQIINLYPADAAAIGRTIRITKEDANAHNVVPTPNGADTIDGVNAAGASSTVTVQFGFVDLMCVGVGAWRSMAARLA